MISFKCFLIKKKKRRGGGGVEGRAGPACVCLNAGSLFGTETILIRLRSRGDIKTRYLWRYHCFKMCWYFACHTSSNICMNHFKRKEHIFLFFHSLFGWRRFGGGGERHIFLLLSLWRKEQCGGVRWWGEIFRERNTASDGNISGRSETTGVCLHWGKYVNPDVTADHSWTKLEPPSAKFSAESDSSVTS